MDRQRIDKWLWHARVVRTRTAAAALVTRAMCGSTASASSREPAGAAGDVVTVALDRTVRVLKVTGFAERRGDADAARAAVRGPDAAAGAAAEPQACAAREPGAGRPTKQERRAIDRLLGRDDRKRARSLRWPS